MKFARIHLSRLSAIVGLVLFASVAFAEGKVITTILADLTLAPGLLRIAADGSNPIKSTHTASVSFNLGLLPAGATIINVTLQVVAKPTKTKNNPQLVKIFPANSEASVGTWTATWTATPGKWNFQVSTSKLLEKFLEARSAVHLLCQGTCERQAKDAGVHGKSSRSTAHRCSLAGQSRTVDRISSKQLQFRSTTSVFQPIKQVHLNLRRGPWPNRLDHQYPIWLHRCPTQSK